MKFRFLDGLRGWAALVVVIDHFVFALLPVAESGLGTAHHAAENLIHSTPLYLPIDGDFSVCVFFVLSGLVLSTKFFRTGDQAFVHATAIKRYFRLALPVLGAVLISYTLLKLGAYRNSEVASLSGSYWWQAFWQFPAGLRDALYQGTYGTLMTQNNGYDPVLWTMQYEFLGSFLVFLLLLICGRLRNRWLAYLFVGFIFVKTYYLAFVLGLVIADCYSSPQARLLRQTIANWYWIPILVVSLIMGSYPLGPTTGSLFSNLRFSYLGTDLHVIMHVLGAFGLIVAIMSAKQLQAVFQNRPSIFLGRISFSMYLLHLLVLGSYTSYLFTHLTHQFGYRTAVAISFSPTLIVVVITAWLYTKFVDEPAIALSGKIYARFFKRTPQMSTQEASAADSLVGAPAAQS